MKVASWNVANGLGKDKYLPDVVKGIEDMHEDGNDLIVLPEAWHELEKPADYKGLAKRLGYVATTVFYEDENPWLPGTQHHLLGLSRKYFKSSQPIRLGTRNALNFAAQDPVNDVIGNVVGLHWDSRNEDIRIKQAVSLLEKFESMERPFVAIGDFNSMHGEDKLSKLLNSKFMRAVAKLMPHPRLRSLATRLTEMADGQAIEILEEAGLEDADPKHRATMKLGKLALVQLDHVMVSPKVEVLTHQVYEHSGSDHKAISADLGFLAVSHA